MHAENILTAHTYGILTIATTVTAVNMLNTERVDTLEDFLPFKTKEMHNHFKSVKPLYTTRQLPSSIIDVQ